MNKQALLGQRQYFDMVHGVTLRAIGQLSDQDLDFRPQPEMRSIRELVYHIYSFEKLVGECVRSGKIPTEAEAAANPEKESAKAALAGLTTVAKLQDYASNCHKIANETVNAITDEELSRLIDAPYGSFPAWQYFAFAYDEHWHHRGQLYTYIRLLGKAPLMLYDYENNPA
ncbi:MAG: DinB family protein [Acidobacteriota bacterium]